jgi:DoxX-like protein
MAHITAPRSVFTASKETGKQEVMDGHDIFGEDTTRMTRTITYWVSTGLLAAMSLFAGFAYLSGSPQAVQGFAHVGYPQQLRIILGIAKPLGAIALLVPGMAKLKEWAYAGFAFAWISAFVAHYLAGDGPRAFSPLVLLVLLVVSYLTRPASRRWQAKVTTP